MEWLIGIAIGVVLTIPVAALWSRRTEKRVLYLEARARSAERLAEQGTMTSGLAHEIKNPLSTVGLNIQLLQEDLSDLSGNLDAMSSSQSHDPNVVRDAQDRIGRIDRRFEALARETNRLRETLEDFLRFAGRLQLEKEQANLNTIVEEVADFFAPQAEAAKVHLRTQFAEPVQVDVDVSLLKQALLNLAINAVQAMTRAREQDQPHGGGGELILRTEVSRTPTGPMAELFIVDTGPGISEEVLDKVFQPYFSTRRGGTGLGLPIARRIVEEHGGTMSIHSELGRGTQMILRLSVSEEG